MSEFDVIKGFTTICSRINQVCVKHGLNIKPRLVAVSKTKPKEMIISVYNEGHRHFGENYIQELIDKSTDSEILEKCKEIKWHFIGNIQRNKVNKLVRVPCLYVVETVDSDKLALALEQSWAKLERASRLKVMVQVNTSRKTEKHGCGVEDCVGLVSLVRTQCPHLELVGLMTIGRLGHDPSIGPNPDFLCLKACRDEVCEQLDIDKKHLELSMGMSDDFEHAIELGSSSVRVGSSIFGTRPNKENITELTEHVKNVVV